MDFQLKIQPGQTIATGATAELGPAANAGFMTFRPLLGVFLHVAALLAEHIAIGELAVTVAGHGLNLTFGRFAVIDGFNRTLFGPASGITASAERVVHDFVNTLLAGLGTAAHGGDKLGSGADGAGATGFVAWPISWEPAHDCTASLLSAVVICFSPFKRD